MSYFMNNKYDNVGGVRDVILRNILASTRLKKFDVPIVINRDNEFVVHKILNQLPTSFDQLKVNTMLKRINEYR